MIQSVSEHPSRCVPVSKQLHTVYLGQLSWIKAIRHDNVGRRSNEGRALDEASLKSPAKCSHSHSLVSLCVVLRWSLLFCFDFFPLIYSFATKPQHVAPPPHTHTQPVVSAWLQPYIWYHAPYQANCAAKGIISVHCRQPVKQSSLCCYYPAFPFPLPPFMLNLVQHPFIVSLQGRELCPSCLGVGGLSGPCWPRCSLVPGGFLGVSDTVLAKGENWITKLLSEH